MTRITMELCEPKCHPGTMAEPLTPTHLMQQNPQNGTRSGFSLVEVMVALAVLTIGLGAVTLTLTSTHTLSEWNKDRRAAENSLHAICEEILALSDSHYGAELGWSSALSSAIDEGGSLGGTFSVGGLSPIEGEASVGTIRVVLSEMLTDANLGVQLGLPRDLDGNQFVGDPDVRLSAHILPIVVKVRWAGPLGDQELTQGFFVQGY